MSEFDVPWRDPAVAAQQRELVDAQLAQPISWPPQFKAISAAVQYTRCPGSVLEYGCGSGYNREVLDRAGVPYRSYAGLDISDAALAIARERYPESQWGNPDIIAKITGRADIVIDGSCLLHTPDWRAHLDKLCSLSKRWLILHRVPVDATPGTGAERSDTAAYGQSFPAWRFSADDIVAEMTARGFCLANAYMADGESRTFVFARPRQWATYCDGNYLPRLIALRDSMVRRCWPFKLNVLAWDEKVRAWCEREAAANVTGQWINFESSEYWLGANPEFEADKLPGPARTRAEYYWTCGPQWIADRLDLGGEPVTYVDADVMFFGSPEPIFAEIGDAAAGVIPHGFAPAVLGLPGPTQETHEQFGRFNVGIVHVAQPVPAKIWADECRLWCYDKPTMVSLTGDPRHSRLLYGDQKFLDNWPTEFGARIVTHPGACLGPWAIHTRALDVRNGVIHFGNRPLISYHYHGYRELPHGETQFTRPEYLVTERQKKIIYAPYLEALAKAKGDMR